MGSPNGSNDTTHTPPPLSFYNTFNPAIKSLLILSNISLFDWDFKTLFVKL